MISTSDEEMLWLGNLTGCYMRHHIIQPILGPMNAPQVRCKASSLGSGIPDRDRFTASQVRQGDRMFSVSADDLMNLNL